MKSGKKSKAVKAKPKSSTATPQRATDTSAAGAAASNSTPSLRQPTLPESFLQFSPRVPFKSAPQTLASEKSTASTSASTFIDGPTNAGLAQDDGLSRSLTLETVGLPSAATSPAPPATATSSLTAGLAQNDDVAGATAGKTKTTSKSKSKAKTKSKIEASSTLTPREAATPSKPGRVSVVADAQITTPPQVDVEALLSASSELDLLSAFRQSQPSHAAVHHHQSHPTSQTKNGPTSSTSLSGSQSTPAATAAAAATVSLQMEDSIVATPPTYHTGSSSAGKAASSLAAPGGPLDGSVFLRPSAAASSSALFGSGSFSPTTPTPMATLTTNAGAASVTPTAVSAHSTAAIDTPSSVLPAAMTSGRHVDAAAVAESSPTIKALLAETSAATTAAAHLVAVASPSLNKMQQSTPVPVGPQATPTTMGTPSSKGRGRGRPKKRSDGGGQNEVEGAATTNVVDIGPEPAAAAAVEETPVSGSHNEESSKDSAPPSALAHAVTHATPAPAAPAKHHGMQLRERTTSKASDDATPARATPSTNANPSSSAKRSRPSRSRRVVLPASGPAILVDPSDASAVVTNGSDVTTMGTHSGGSNSAQVGGLGEKFGPLFSFFDEHLESLRIGKSHSRAASRVVSVSRADSSHHDLTKAGKKKKSKAKSATKTQPDAETGVLVDDYRQGNGDDMSSRFAVEKLTQQERDELRTEYETDSSKFLLPDLSGDKLASMMAELLAHKSDIAALFMDPPAPAPAPGLGEATSTAQVVDELSTVRDLPEQPSTTPLAAAEVADQVDEKVENGTDSRTADAAIHDTDNVQPPSSQQPALSEVRSLSTESSLILAVSGVPSAVASPTQEATHVEAHDEAEEEALLAASETAAAEEVAKKAAEEAAAVAAAEEAAQVAATAKKAEEEAAAAAVQKAAEEAAAKAEEEAAAAKKKAEEEAAAAAAAKKAEEEAAAAAAAKKAAEEAAAAAQLVQEETMQRNATTAQEAQEWVAIAAQCEEEAAKRAEDAVRKAEEEAAAAAAKKAEEEAAAAAAAAAAKKSEEEAAAAAVRKAEEEAAAVAAAAAAKKAEEEAAAARKAEEEAAAAAAKKAEEEAAAAAAAKKAEEEAAAAEAEAAAAKKTEQEAAAIASAKMADEEAAAAAAVAAAASRKAEEAATAAAAKKAEEETAAAAAVAADDDEDPIILTSAAPSKPASPRKGKGKRRGKRSKAARDTEDAASPTQSAASPNAAAVLHEEEGSTSIVQEGEPPHDNQNGEAGQIAHVAQSVEAVAVPATPTRQKSRGVSKTKSTPPPQTTLPLSEVGSPTVVTPRPGKASRRVATPSASMAAEQAIEDFLTERPRASASASATAARLNSMSPSVVRTPLKTPLRPPLRAAPVSSTRRALPTAKLDPEEKTDKMSRQATDDKEGVRDDEPAVTKGRSLENVVGSNEEEEEKANEQPSPMKQHEDVLVSPGRDRNDEDARGASLPPLSSSTSAGDTGDTVDPKVLSPMVTTTVGPSGWDWAGVDTALPLSVLIRYCGRPLPVTMRSLAGLAGSLPRNPKIATTEYEVISPDAFANEPPVQVILLCFGTLSDTPLLMSLVLHHCVVAARGGRPYVSNTSRFLTAVRGDATAPHRLMERTLREILFDPPTVPRSVAVTTTLHSLLIRRANSAVALSSFRPGRTPDFGGGGFGHGYDSNGVLRQVSAAAVGSDVTSPTTITSRGDKRTKRGRDETEGSAGFDRNDDQLNNDDDEDLEDLDDAKLQLRFQKKVDAMKALIGNPLTAPAPSSPTAPAAGQSQRGDVDVDGQSPKRGPIPGCEGSFYGGYLAGGNATAPSGAALFGCLTQPTDARLGSNFGGGSFGGNGNGSAVHSRSNGGADRSTSPLLSDTTFPSPHPSFSPNSAMFGGGGAPFSPNSSQNGQLPSQVMFPNSTAAAVGTAAQYQHTGSSQHNNGNGNGNGFGGRPSFDSLGDDCLMGDDDSTAAPEVEADPPQLLILPSQIRPGAFGLYVLGTMNEGTLVAYYGGEKKRSTDGVESGYRMSVPGPWVVDAQNKRCLCSMSNDPRNTPFKSNCRFAQASFNVTMKTTRRVSDEELFVTYGLGFKLKTSEPFVTGVFVGKRLDPTFAVLAAGSELGEALKPLDDAGAVTSAKAHDTRRRALDAAAKKRAARKGQSGEQEVIEVQSDDEPPKKKRAQEKRRRRR